MMTDGERPISSAWNDDVIWRQPCLMTLVHGDVGSLKIPGEGRGIEQGRTASVLRQFSLY